MFEYYDMVAQQMEKGADDEKMAIDGLSAFANFVQTKIEASDQNKVKAAEFLSDYEPYTEPDKMMLLTDTLARSTQSCSFTKSVDPRYKKQVPDCVDLSKELSEKWAKNQLAFVVSYPDTEITSVEYSYKMNFEDFFGQIGGFLGLWTGASIMSFIHVAVFIAQFAFPKLDPIQEETPEDHKKADMNSTDPESVKTTSPTDNPKLTDKAPPVATLYPMPASTPESAPKPTAGPTPAPSPAPTPEPTPKHAPGPIPQPKPKPASEPTPKPASEPTPKPASEPTPKAAPEATPKPASQPTPKAMPEPTPKPASEPTPKPASEPTPKPASEPTPTPDPKPNLPNSVDTADEESSDNEDDD